MLYKHSKLAVFIYLPNYICDQFVYQNEPQYADKYNKDQHALHCYGVNKDIDIYLQEYYFPTVIALSNLYFLNVLSAELYNYDKIMSSYVCT